MAKSIDPLKGFTLRDILSKDGVTFEFGDEIRDEEEEYPYNPNIQLTNEEVLNLLNMEEFQDDNKDDNDDDISNSLCGMSFDKIKLKMTDLTGNGKVLKLVKRKGVGEIIPNDAQGLLHYVGYFEYRDEPFDSSFIQGGPKRLRLQQGELIPGLEIGIRSMRKHEIAAFLLHPDVAFGKFGCPPRIPGNEEVLFVVHLLDFLDNGSATTYETLTFEERKLLSNVAKCANAMLVTAKDNFQRHKIRQAIREYNRVVSWIENVDLNNDEEEQEANKLLSKAYNNLAVCYNREDKPRLACASANRVPIPTAKTHFNHGRALLRMGEYTRAMQELQIAHKMEPSNKDTINEIRLVNEKQRRYREMEKQLCAKSLKNISQQETDMGEFENAAHDICKSFAMDDKLLRHELPDGLTSEEEKCIRKHAAALGMSVTEHVRYERRILYLNKPNY